MNCLEYSFDGGNFEVGMSTNTANFGMNDYLIVIHPNPTKEHLTVQHNQTSDAFDLELYDLSGKLITTQDNSNQN